MKRVRIPDAEREKILERPPYCERSSPVCAGSIEWDHAVTWVGRNIQEAWAIVIVCQYHHGTGEWMNSGGGHSKAKNRAIAMARATDEDKKKYPRLDWKI